MLVSRKRKLLLFYYLVILRLDITLGKDVDVDLFHESFIWQILFWFLALHSICLYSRCISSDDLSLQVETK